jgi:chromosome segregation ATPase
MHLVASFNTLEIGLFLFVLCVLAGTIWLFLTSMDNLKQLKAEQREQYAHLNFFPPVKETIQASVWLQLKRLWLQLVSRKAAVKTARPVKLRAEALSIPENKDHSISDIKSLLNQQQYALQQLQRQLDETVEKEEKTHHSKAQQKVEELEIQLEEKEAEIQQLLQQQKITDKIMMRLEEVQKEFSFMQERMGLMEKQAATAQQLSLELEDLQESHARLEAEYARKSEKLQQYMSEASKLHQQLCDTEDKLQEANQQRQQLQKKVKLLEELNSDMQTMTAANKHMQTELRRIGELESMLNMMTEERDQLLRKRF